MILAVAGSAVGLGNFLRFPGQAAQNGGGAFMIPYFCALLFLGIPICWAEWTMGKYGGRFGFNSCPAIFGLLGRHKVWRYLGVLGLLIPIMIYTYYVLIESWCLGYAWMYLYGAVDLGSDPNQYAANSTAMFNNFTGANQDGLMLDGKLHISVIVWMIVFALNFFLIYRGITKGIESFCKFAIPLMALCAFAVLIRVLTLGTPNPDKPDLNVLNGLGFMWNPHDKGGGPWYTALGSAQTWLAAAGQIFFSLSVGFGVIVNYASYLRPKDDIVLSGLTASSTNEFFEVCLGGLITIPAAFIFLGAAGASVTGTFDLGFKTLPIVFLYMPGGRIFGFLWFFMLFLAAITSSISLLQPVIAFFEEALGVGRAGAVAVLAVITAAGSGYVIWFSQGLAALDTLDFWVVNIGIFLFAIIEIVLLSWAFGARRALAEAREGAELRPAAWVYRVLMAYVTPVFLLVVFIFWSYYHAPAYLEAIRGGGVPQYSVVVILAVLALYVAFIHRAEPRWDRLRAAPTREVDT